MRYILWLIIISLLIYSLIDWKRNFEKQEMIEQRMRTQYTNLVNGFDSKNSLLLKENWELRKLLFDLWELHNIYWDWINWLFSHRPEIIERKNKIFKHLHQLDYNSIEIAQDQYDLFLSISNKYPRCTNFCLRTIQMWNYIYEKRLIEKKEIMTLYERFNHLKNDFAYRQYKKEFDEI